MARIEDEIKQKKFQSEYHKLTVNILYTSSWLHTKHHLFFKPFGISPQQYNILRILRGQHPKPAPLKLLTERMIDKMSNTSRLVDKLYIKKLVERRTCSTNRRQVDILITDKGLELLEKMSARMDEKLEMNETLTLREAKELNTLLDKWRG
jgi:DNA-binding MarR family transcriptional regulator